MSVISNNQLAGAAGQGGSGPYEIKRSLRFNGGDSANLTKTFSSGNQKTFTLSFWVKGACSTSYYNRPIFTYGSTTASYFDINFTTAGVFQFSDYYTYYIQTSAKFRDPSAWYHFVVSIDTTQSTAADRVKLYVNGVETATGGSDPAQNLDFGMNMNQVHAIGSSTNSSGAFVAGSEMYLAEYHFVEGQQLAASDFGEYDDNNVWQPKKYSGSYGSNGFYLKFEDNSSVSALGTDSSGNDNDWTVTNLSVTAGATNDSLLDTPTDYEADSGNPGGNYCTLNPLTATTNFVATDGNLKGTMSGGTGGCLGTMAFPKTGKWYFEVVFDSVPGYNHVGIATAKSNCIVSSANPGYDTTNEFTYWQNGSKTNNVAYGATFAANDVIGVAFDADAGSLVFYKNGTSQGVNATGLFDTYFPFIPGFASFTSVANFGQRPWAQTPPTGYKALCTFNFPDPSIIDSSTVFDAVAYAGNSGDGLSTTQDIAMGFSPDLVWIKPRSVTGTSQLFDQIRGAGIRLHSDNSNSESTKIQTLSQFNSDGFRVNGDNSVNDVGVNYISWNWDAGSSNTSVSANTLTSSSFDQSETWSDSVTCASGFYSGFPATYGFNAFGSYTAGCICNGSSTDPIVFTYPNAITLTSLRIRLYPGQTHTITVAGTAITVGPVGGLAGYFEWVDVPLPAGGISLDGSSDTIIVGGTSWNYTGGYEINGKELVDPGITLPTTPSIATTYRANASAGFSIVSYTGTGANATVAHGLNAEPEFIMFKNRDGSDYWSVWHHDFSIPYAHALYLNDSANVQNYGGSTFNYTLPSSNVIHLGSENNVNHSAEDIIAYCWTGVEGYSKFGSFTSGSDPFVYTGFKPKFVLLKRSDASAHWYMFDSVRGTTNANETWIEANGNGAEQTHGNGAINFLSNGFQPIGSDIDPSNGTFIYAAFAEQPFKYTRAR